MAIKAGYKVWDLMYILDITYSFYEIAIFGI